MCKSEVCKQGVTLSLSAIMPQRPHSELWVAPFGYDQGRTKTCGCPRILTLWDSCKIMNVIHYLFSISLQKMLSIAQVKREVDPRQKPRSHCYLYCPPNSAMGVHMHRPLNKFSAVTQIHHLRKQIRNYLLFIDHGS